ncbi:MAG: hypothetical protein Q8O67_27620 [Deltaproteobacteria bacterium]|nr:hypothetical protein [Deltaproteobacteria bacterium]
MIALLVFAIVFAVMAGNYGYRISHLKRLAETLGGQRLLTRGSRALQTREYILEIVDAGWRVEVPRMQLGRRMVLTLNPGMSPLGMRTGFADVDRAFRITGDDADLAATIFADQAVRDSLHRLARLTKLARIDLTGQETLVVLFRRRWRVSEVEALDGVVAFANALQAVAHVKAQVSAGTSISGGVGGASGSPFAMPISR